MTSTEHHDELRASSADAGSRATAALVTARAFSAAAQRAREQR